MSSFLVSTKKYSYTDFLPFFLGPVKISLSKESEKNIKRSQKYLVHDPDNSAKEGDNVQITSSRPISKMKRWRLFKIQENNDNIPVSLNKDDSKWYSLKQD